MNPDLNKKISDELRRMEEDCTHSGKAHFNACVRWNRWNYLIGLPSVALSATAGTAFLKSYPTVAGALASVVTVLTGLMTFLKPSERSTTHKNAGDQYLALRNASRVYREIEFPRMKDEDGAVAGMRSLTKRRDELNKATPQFSDADFAKARQGVNAGEATHKVDKKRSS